jgi:putative membrane protein
MVWYGGGMSNFFGFLLMTINALLFGALLLIAITFVVRYASERPRRGWAGPHPGSRSEQILAERFARGELDEQEYHQRLRVLRGLPGEPPAGTG